MAAGVYKDLPFPRGSTISDNGLETPDATLATNLEGQEYVTEDRGSGGADRTGRPVVLRVVRNVSGGNLLPKRLVTFQKNAGVYGSRVDGYATVTADVAYPVDEHLPAAGVANNDLFYIVVEGPALVLTDLAGGANNVINAGDVLVSLTAATSGATTAGRVAVQDLTGATAVLGKQIKNRIGYALTAATTGETGKSILCDIG
jgi:hypothetical protein